MREDERKQQIAITTRAGRTLEVRLMPGNAHWSGYTVVREGVIIADEILVERHLTLVGPAGQRFEAEQRSYTLENLAGEGS